MKSMYIFDLGGGGNCINFLATLALYNIKRDTSLISFPKGSSHEYIQHEKNLILLHRISDLNQTSEFDILKNIYGNFDYIKVYFTSLRDLRISKIFHFVKAIRNSIPSLVGESYKLLDTDQVKNEYKKWVEIDYLYQIPEIDVNHPYKENIWLWNFDDILNNKSKTISFIEQLTNQSALPELEIMYDRYLNVQLDIINKFYTI